MAIDKGRLVVGPTKRRDQEKQYYISYITNTEPGYARAVVDESGTLISDPQLPEVEGQIAVWQKASGDEAAQAYVVVRINNVLTWVRVLHALDLQDTRTSEAWDPLAGFYNPLAS